ncbi:MAG: trigger factor [Bacteroidia bacterium]|nr:trigger factor [Bacteroidia bacterium]
MNISAENIDALNVVLTMTISKSDYQPNVEQQLKEARKNAVIPGFRKGHAPAGMINKMYGAQALAQEFNRAIETGLKNHIIDNKLEIFGEPLPHEGEQPVDLDNLAEETTMKFDIALRPAVEVNLSKVKVTYYDIESSDEDIEKFKTSKLARFSKRQDVEVSSEESMITASLKADDFSKESTLFAVKNINDTKVKKQFVGVKVGDVVKANLKKAFENKAELAYVLGIEEAKIDEAADKYEVTISGISEYVNPELNEETFKLMYGEDTDIKTVEAFEAKCKEELAALLENDSRYKFSLDLREELTKACNVELPEAFLRRWIEIVNHDNAKMTPEVFENEFPRFLEDLKWQTISNSVVKAAGIELTPELLKKFALKVARAQYERYGLTGLTDDILAPMAENMLKDQQQREHLVEGAVSEAMTEYAFNNVKLNHKAISRDKFAKLFEEK